MQLIDAIWYARRAVGRRGRDLRRRRLAPARCRCWSGSPAYIGALVYFVPRIKERSTEASEARSMLVGRIVDSYTNILTVKLFAHAEREDDYARAALHEQIEQVAGVAAPQTAMELVLYTLNGVLIVSATGLAIWLWSRDAVSRSAPSPSSPASCMRIIGMSGWILWVVAGIFENIGVVQEGMETISRANQVVDRPDSRPLVVREGEIRFENVSFHYGRAVRIRTRAARRRHRRPVAAHRAGREGRPRRPLGRRQVDARQPAAALLRPRGGPHPDRRPGHRRTSRRTACARRSAW